MEFYKYIKRCRKKNHITQEELVSSLCTYDRENFENLDTVTLSRWERDHTKPNTHKQLGIIKYFQSISDEALPCWDQYTSKEVEDLICTVGIQNVLSKPKQLILNFPSTMMSIDDVHVYPIVDMEKAKNLFALNMDLHCATNHPYTQITLEQFESWAAFPCTLFLAAEYKGSFVGLFFSLRVKEHIFQKIINMEMKNSEIKESDFAQKNEVGSIILLSFYAINQKVASMLFVRHYAYLIANQKIINEIGVSTVLEEVQKTVENMNLEHFKSKKMKDSTKVEVYKATLGKVLASEYVVKMIFSE